MANEIAKLLLEHAETIADRKSAIQKALGMGMPLGEVEEYLDWLDTVRSGSEVNESEKKGAPDKKSPSSDSQPNLPGKQPG